MSGSLIACITKKLIPFALRNANKVTSLLHEVSQGPLNGGIDDILSSPSLFSKTITTYKNIITNNYSTKQGAKAAFSSGRLRTMS